MKKHSHGGEEIYPPRTKRAGKRGNCLFQLLCHFFFFSYSVIWIFPSSHSGSTSSSRFISASAFFDSLPLSHHLRHLWFEVVDVYNLPQTLHRQMVCKDNLSSFGKRIELPRGENVLPTPSQCRDALLREYFHQDHVCRGMSSRVCLLIALTPLPDCISNNQRGRLNIYEVYTELVRIQSRLSL